MLRSILDTKRTIVFYVVIKNFSALSFKNFLAEFRAKTRKQWINLLFNRKLLTEDLSSASFYLIELSVSGRLFPLNVLRFRGAVDTCDDRRCPNELLQSILSLKTTPSE